MRAVEANRAQWDGLAGRVSEGGPTCGWAVGDAREVLPALGPEERFDLVFSCPPYADLEVYSDDPRDLSTMDYPAFLAAYREIVAASVARLREDRFALFVVGDVRDERGFLRSFPADTVRAFADAGATLHGDAVLVTMAATAPLRGSKFQRNRKLIRTHQNVLIFFKGDPKRIYEVLGDVVVASPDGDGAETGVAAD